jgi:4-hydroxybenzoate polyprenyltransferase
MGGRAGVRARKDEAAAGGGIRPEAAVGRAPVTGRRSPPWLRLLRPRQWTKNLAAYAPLLFAKSVFAPGAALKATQAVVCFSLLASGVYVFNDWMDRDRDRVHPEKRERPIAAGLIGGRQALALGAALGAAGAVLAWALGPRFAWVAGSYVALQVAYSFAFKRMVILDVLVIAMGFVLRVVGGGTAIGVPISNWLFLCTLLLALFLGFAKRRHELASLHGDAVAHRASLSDYSLPMLDQMISVVAAACIVAYGLYTVSVETIAHVGSDRLKYTLPCVVYGIFRYLFLVHRRGAGGSPERVLLSDGPLMVAVLVYVGLSAAVLYLL